MSCERYDELIDDYVDGVRVADAARDPGRAAFEAHLAGCARCQSMVADFASIRRTAAALEEHVPPPRLWAKVASALDDDRRRFPFARWAPFAMAASLALLVGGVAWMSWTQRENAAAERQASTPAESAPLPAEQPYEQAIAGLQQLADAQDAALDAGTRAVLRENLALIDRAISESRAALESDPASGLAEESLLDALDTKVALLQDTVALASDDDASDEAAAAAKEVNQ